MIAAGLAACGGPPAPAPPVVEARPASAPSCEATADHVATLAKDAAGRLRRAVAVRCAEDRWSIETRACMTGTRTLDEPRRCKDTLTPPQREALERDLRLAATPPPPPPLARASNIPSACVAYAELLERIMSSCDQLPDPARDALRQGFDALTGISSDVMPPEALDAMNDACRQATDALAQAAKPLCGW